MSQYTRKRREMRESVLEEKRMHLPSYLTNNNKNRYRGR